MRPLILATLIGWTTAAAGAENIFPEGAKPKLAAQGAGEGPAWHPSIGLLFSGRGGIERISRDGKQSMFRERAGSNGLLFDARGRLLICEPVQRRVTRLEADGKLTVLTDRFSGKRYNQPNDITIDSKGRVYFSDPKYGPRDNLELRDDADKPVEGVYRIDPNGKVARVITHEVDRPNGLLITPDDRFLYVADNNNNDVGGARKLWRFNLKKNGTVNLSSRKLIYDWKSGRGPDGMVQDVKGRLYVAGGLNKPNPPAETNDFKGGVYVFSKQGKFLEFIHIPRDEVTNCTFGGPQMKTLYITAGGTLWSIPTTTRGWAPWAREKKRKQTKPPAGPQPTRVEVYKKVGQATLKMHIFEPAGHKATDRRAAIVFFFGGGWIGGSPSQFYRHADHLAKKGVLAMAAEYRVASRNKTSPFECVKDGKSAVRWVRANADKLGVDPDRVAAGGGSAGGHVAAATGTVPGLNEKGEDTKVSCVPNALVLFNPVYDNGPDGYGYNRVKDRYREISPFHNLRKGTPPAIVFLGTKDRLIPVATAKKYQAKMQEVGSRGILKLYEGAGHGFFNYGRGGNKHYEDTVKSMDEFLGSLSWFKSVGG